MSLNEALRALTAHARSTYPAECCGFLFQEADGGFRFAAVANVAGSAQGQATSARSQRDGYVMDSKEQLRALDENDQRGGALYAIVHSHPDVGAYFSNEDKHMALGDGDEPLWPGVRYIVVSVRQGVVDAVRLYTWDAAARDFLEEDIAEMATDLA
jgi:adenylyltransferase/sulfurtransferase